MFRSLYQLRAFNGDPHPGNYLFQPDGRVTFLDFGLVKHFTEAEIGIFGDMIQAMVIEGDTARYRRIIEQIGLLKPGAPVSDRQVHEYFSHFYEFVMHDDVVTITPEWSTDALSRYFDPSGPYGPVIKAANLPASFVIIQRINLGLMAILGDLRATANFRGIADELWPWVDGAPSTEMGKAEADWLASGRHRRSSAVPAAPRADPTMRQWSTRWATARGAALRPRRHRGVARPPRRRRPRRYRRRWVDPTSRSACRSTVTCLLRCPRRALSERATRPDGRGAGHKASTARAARPKAKRGGTVRGSGHRDDLVAGWYRRRRGQAGHGVAPASATVDAALAFLTAPGDSTVTDHLADRGGPGAPPSDAARIDQLAAGTGPPRSRLVAPRRRAGSGGVRGRRRHRRGTHRRPAGRRPHRRPAVIVEVKAGRWHDGMRADAHLYALMVALRDGEAPASAVTIVSDGTTHVEPIRPALLQHAAERLDQAMGIAARFAAGEPPAMHPGAHCQHCPVRPDCPVGRAWRPGTVDDAS